MSYFDIGCLWIGRAIVGCAGIAVAARIIGWLLEPVMSFIYIELLCWSDRQNKRRPKGE